MAGYWYCGLQYRLQSNAGFFDFLHDFAQVPTPAASASVIALRDRVAEFRLQGAIDFVQVFFGELRSCHGSFRLGIASCNTGSVVDGLIGCGRAKVRDRANAQTVHLEASLPIR